MSPFVTSFLKSFFIPLPQILRPCSHSALWIALPSFLRHSTINAMLCHSLRCSSLCRAQDSFNLSSSRSSKGTHLINSSEWIKQLIKKCYIATWEHLRPSKLAKKYLKSRNKRWSDSWKSSTDIYCWWHCKLVLSFWKSIYNIQKVP